VSRLCEFYPGICLTTEEKARKNLSQGKKNLSQVKKNLSQSTETSVRVQKSQSEYSLLLLGYRPVQHVTVLNTVDNFNTMVGIIILYNITS